MLLLQVIQVILELIVVLLQIVYSIVLSAVYLILPKQQKSVRGEIVLITGGGNGIGKELAFLYASEGATVVIWDINEKMGNQTVEEIVGRGYPQAHFFYCDVSNRDNVLNVAKNVEEKVGTVTILINNAGFIATHSLLDHTPFEILKTMNVNIMAQFWTLEAFLPNMEKNNHGHVVALSSSAGLFGIPNMVSYCCSKFAVRGLMNALYEEYRQTKNKNIKFTTIDPFFVNTDMCPTWKMRFEYFMPVIQVEHAAKEIIKAQKLNLKEITLPRHLYYLTFVFRLFPEKAQNYLTDFAAVCVDSDIFEKKH